MVVDGKVINIKTAEKMNFELNKALVDPNNFKLFANDPKAFVKGYKLDIDTDISNQLSRKLKGVASLETLRSMSGDGTVEATVWAVAVGAYSVASTKIAVAF
jgi:hypothetical protein